MSLIDKALTDEFESGEKISRIYLTKDKNADDICPGGDLYIDGSEEYLLPNAPLPLLKRLDEWHRISNSERLKNIDKELEYQWLVNTLNSFLKEKYGVCSKESEERRRDTTLPLFQLMLLGSYRFPLQKLQELAF